MTERVKLAVTREQAAKLRALTDACVDPTTGAVDDVKWGVGVMAIVGQALKPGNYEVTVRFRRPRMPQHYRSDAVVQGMPLRWQDDATGELPNSIMKYLTWASEPGKPAPEGEEIDLIREYLVYHIKAPCWRNVQAGQDPEMAKEIETLIGKAEQILDLDDIGRHINDCLEIGLDPL
jgi:hypothetical protein